MKIAMVYELFWPAHGGVEVWIAEVSKELVKRGYEVDIITGALPNTPMQENMDGLNILRVDLDNIMKKLYISGSTNLVRQIFWSFFAGRLFWKRHKEKYDIIHAHVQSSFLAALLGTKDPKKIVWSWHGTYHEQLYSMYSLPVAAMYHMLEHIVIKLPYAACITADNYTKKLAVDHMGADPNKIYPIRNGVDVDKFKPKRVARPDDWPDGLCVVTARRLVPKTGVQYLIPAFKEIVKLQEDVHLIIYGDGPLKPKLVEMTNKLGLEKHVHFMGVISYNKMPVIYNAADIIVVPSLIEATSLSCLEAMACGKVLITCPVGGIPEVAPKDLVVYAQPGNIKSLASCLKKVILNMDETDRKKIGLLMRKHVVKNFTWEQTVNKVLNVYDIVTS